MVRDTRTPLHNAQNADIAFFLHDLYNILCVAVVIILDAYYLSRTTDTKLIGTNDLGLDYRQLFMFMWYFFSVYMIVDTIWIYFMPRIASAGATPIIIHHVLTLVDIMVPYSLPQFQWHMGVALLVEANTLLLTLRRNAPAESLVFHILNYLFLCSWIVLRLVLYPMLTLFFYYEWHRYSRELGGSYANLFAIGLVMQILLTCMGFKWTYDLALKFFAKPDKLS